jgi:formate-dependent nitrite reductase membrane component NrfD
MNAPPQGFHYGGESYYGRPAVKPSPYRWKVALYTFLGGLAGAVQVIVTLADLVGSKKYSSLVKKGRVVAALNGTVVGPALLIADLHTPQRWYNMLRIFRRTSPMSIGSYVLTAFGGFSALSLVPRIESVTQIPAALAGAAMASYTPALLAATATPLWASTPRALGAEFASAAFASGAAALMLFSKEEGLEQAACAATLAYGAASFAANREHRKKGVDRALRRGKWAKMHKAGLGLSVALPLACFALNAIAGRSARRSAIGAAGILAGVFLSRWALLEAGNESAREPQDYLRLTSPGHG